MSNAKWIELAPCPFCGSQAQTDFMEDVSYIIECHACEATTGCQDSEDAAIAAWNRRSGSSMGAAQPSAMTLRDYFAAKALPAVLSLSADGINERFPNEHFRHPESPGRHMTSAQWWAEQAYQVADAMLAARFPAQ